MPTKASFIVATMTVVTALALPWYAASAATTASAVTPLNIRSGPGPQYSVIGAIPAKGQASVTGCIQGSLWCQISYNGKQGWAYSQYLTATMSGRQLAVSERVAELPPVTYTAPAATVGTTVIEPTISGELIAPGDVPLSLVPPPPTAQTYVISHPVAPVYLNGEVVEGAGLPKNVILTPVPQSSYDYAYVNGVPVLVEPSSRRVTYIYR